MQPISSNVHRHDPMTPDLVILAQHCLRLGVVLDHVLPWDEWPDRQ